MEFRCKAAKISIYINSERKTIAQIKAETGCTAIINGGLFNTGTFTATGNLKVDGVELVREWDATHGFYWSGDDPLRFGWYDMKGADNFIGCIAMIENGKAIVPMSYPAEMGGARQRSAFGLFPDGDVWLYATQAGTTPEALQQIALAAGVQHAIMLDGGGSTQCIFPDGKLTSTRKVHNYICVWEDQTNKKGDDTVFKIALGAGHGINTAGKRCLKSLDPNETREWWLNDRVCDYVESYLKSYEGYDLLRLDDSDDGKDDTALAARVNAANNWDADVYISVHHNAGANGTKAGGIVAYCYHNASKASVEWRDELYATLIKHTGLKGNRYDGTLTAGFDVLRYTDMPAVLLELGFMDSSVDVPVILSNEFAQQCARAIVDVIVKRGGLTKKAVEQQAVYKVQLGAFGNKSNAESLAKELKGKGYQVYITQV